MAKLLHHSPEPAVLILANSTTLAEFDSLVDRSVAPSEVVPPIGLLTGRIIAFSADSIPSVECRVLSSGAALSAASLVPLDRSHVGRRVALMCADGDAGRPIILGLLAIDPESLNDGATPPQATVRVDGKSVTLSASEEIVLQCGKASIVLTQAGKVVIRGAYISSASTGVHRIKGGAIQIN
jgi:hypothetical protein